MPQTALVNPNVTINNAAVLYEPNSISYTEGKGERTVRTHTTGGGQRETVVSEDISTQRSKVKFSILSTVENIKALKGWQELKDSNGITLSSKGFTRTSPRAIIVNDPDVNISVDGMVEVEFESDPAS